MIKQRLNRISLEAGQKHVFDELTEAPVTVLQIGEGNFLRGFFDWMIHESRKQGLFQGSVAVVQPRPSGKPKIEELAEQDGLYTLVTRGLENGSPVERKQVITVFSSAFDPYSDWEQFFSLAKQPQLRFVVSNTTEAGLVYRQEAYSEGKPVQSFPGKLTQLLYERYIAFNGDPAKGLICLPCELLERNGDTLRECVLRYCEDWRLPQAFRSWVVEHNRFLNSLVDRIVTGYPDAKQAEQWFAEWGYEDPLLTTAEPYHLWAIEGESELEQQLPLASAGLNVLWVDDLKPFQQRKVRILNGAHTFMALLGMLKGLSEVRAAMEHDELGVLIIRTIESEIIPSLPYDQTELQTYAKQVCERFLNPFIQHRLSDITMNSLSKFQTRLLPSLKFYLQHNEAFIAQKDQVGSDGESVSLPQGLAAALAALLRHYRIVKVDESGYWGQSFTGEQYLLRDDRELLIKLADIWALFHQAERSLQETVAVLLSLEELWQSNLHAAYPQLAEQITSIIEQWEREL
ncbi:altronate oxidoreductase [Paenibacillus montaniterrae]|uniref:Altronate oxidoreductase n=1 Tax=Paenibacillus montaniterrae TaxID=429341 RepID=A0A919YU33_9BACL|nr:tagaturonate reductase [Paenibacillus montaniterrae]GIP17306.1 altronate oxidoreductase [Paenibacillus montaniterrae]